jgi:serine/threonine-protein kinase RsbW
MTAATFQFKSAELPDLDDMRRFVEQSAFKLGATEDAVGEMVLAVNEAVTNILLHGYRSRPGGVEIAVEGEGDRLIVSLRDRAPHYDPTAVPPPNLALTLDERPLGGLGVHMMRQFTDELRYRVTEDGENELLLIKHAALSPSGQPQKVRQTDG